MRKSLLAGCLLLCVAPFLAAAQAQPALPAPPQLEPLPEIAPPPDLDNAELEPQVTISQTNSETREEARVNGILMWIRVTPRHGRPYYLIPNPGGYAFIRRDSLDTGLKVPMWVLFSW